MTSYRYRAARTDGAIVAGMVDAPSAGEATAVLAQRGLFPVAVTSSGDEAERRPPARRRDLAIAFRSIAALVSAGVPLERALGASELLTRGPLRETLAAAREGLREGQGLAQALAARRGVIPSVALGMIRAGERGSQLTRALEQVATHLEHEADMVARVHQALAYPLFLAVAGTVSVLVIGIVVVPRFAELLRDLGQDLPLATRVLLSGSSLVSRFWMLILVGIASGASGVVYALQFPEVRWRFQALALGLPLVGKLRLTLATTRVTRALGGMLSAGMPLLPALDAARDAAGDVAVGRRIAQARERVSQGAPLTASLEHEAALSASALQLLGVGESSGRLGEMALRAGDLSAQEAERGLRTLVIMLEPALMVAFGGLVAFVAAALLQAVYAVRPG